MNQLPEEFVDRVIERVTAGRAAESAQDARVHEEFERAAAALHLAALAGPKEALPASLRDRLQADARAHFAAAERPAASRPDAPRPRLLADEPSGRPAWFAWTLAAASLLFALWTWTARGTDSTPQVITPGRARQDLLAQASDALRWSWTGTEDPLAGGVEGDVVWSDSRQEGFMRFRALAPNDPSKQQYQLWIFDPSRPDETPVDGGVFDVPAGAEEVVVPIDAKLDVTSPKLFAVTLERPGGVVVSTRERLIVLAQGS